NDELVISAMDAEWESTSTYTILTEDSCLGFCFEVHRAVRCGYFYLEFSETCCEGSWHSAPGRSRRRGRLPFCSLRGPEQQLGCSLPEFQ
uniref:Uncharacterized protein n=1 Tax=Canis lupus dingo TaxID=286419 RepID=A0A8C0QZ39_CANLU